MDATTMAMILIATFVLLIAGGLLGYVFRGRQQTKRLQERFGPEYDRAVAVLGSKEEAEEELLSREQHVKGLDIKPIPHEQEEGFVEEWKRTQAMFVESPEKAIREADHLVKEVMIAKGYPAEDFEHRLADLSVDYPEATIHYRRIEEIKTDRGQNGLTTEEMRQTMVLCRDLFEDLLGTRVRVTEASQN